MITDTVAKGTSATATELGYLVRVRFWHERLDRLARNDRPQDLAAEQKVLHAAKLLGQSGTQAADAALAANIISLYRWLRQVETGLRDQSDTKVHNLVALASADKATYDVEVAKLLECAGRFLEDAKVTTGALITVPDVLNAVDGAAGSAAQAGAQARADQTKLQASSPQAVRERARQRRQQAAAQIRLRQAKAKHDAVRRQLPIGFGQPITPHPEALPVTEAPVTRGPGDRAAVG